MGKVLRDRDGDGPLTDRLQSQAGIEGYFGRVAHWSRWETPINSTPTPTSPTALVAAQEAGGLPLTLPVFFARFRHLGRPPAVKAARSWRKPGAARLLRLALRALVSALTAGGNSRLPEPRRAPPRSLTPCLVGRAVLVAVPRPPQLSQVGGAYRRDCYGATRCRAQAVSGVPG